MIRIAQEADIPQMLDIYRYYVENTTYSFEYTPPEEDDFLRRFRAVTAWFPWLVCEEEGRILGYAYGSAPFERAAYQWCSELSVYLRPEERGRGIGKGLYAAAEQILRQQGYHRVYAIITSENEDSMAFHRAVGYETVAVFPNCGIKFDRSVGTVWMEKPLNSVKIPTKAPVAWTAVVKIDRNEGKVLDKMSLS